MTTFEKSMQLAAQIHVVAGELTRLMNLAIEKGLILDPPIWERQYKNPNADGGRTLTAHELYDVDDPDRLTMVGLEMTGLRTLIDPIRETPEDESDTEANPNGG